MHHADEPNAQRKYHLIPGSETDGAQGIPQFIEVSEHIYVEHELACLFETQMAFSQYVSTALWVESLHSDVILIALLANLLHAFTTFR